MSQVKNPPPHPTKRKLLEISLLEFIKIAVRDSIRVPLLPTRKFKKKIFTYPFQIRKILDDTVEEQRQPRIFFVTKPRRRNENFSGNVKF